MSSPNPYESSQSEPTSPRQQHSSDPSLAKATYNVVSDTLTGINVRKRDNLLQMAIIAVFVVVSTVVGAVAALLYEKANFPWFGGAILGSFAGLVLGFFCSGFFLMVYRAIMHLKGRHD